MTDQRLNECPKCGGPAYRDEAGFIRAASPPTLDVERVYAAVRPEFRDDGPGADSGDSDSRAWATAERIHERLVTAATPAAGLDCTCPGNGQFAIGCPIHDPVHAQAVDKCPHLSRPAPLHQSKDNDWDDTRNVGWMCLDCGEQFWPLDATPATGPDAPLWQGSESTTRNAHGIRGTGAA